MADERLQQLRRAWDDGDLETQVRLLRERMRMGELSEERVRLAAYLGSEPALEVIGPGNSPQAEPTLRQAGVSDWLVRLKPQIEGLLDLSTGAVTRLPIPAAWAALATGCLPHDLATIAERALVALEGWITCGSPERREAHDLSRELGMAYVSQSMETVPDEDGVESLTDAEQRRFSISQAVEMACSYFNSSPGALRNSTIFSLQNAQWALEPRTRNGEIPEGVRSAFQIGCDELVPWALGLRDPVAERVAARKSGGSG